jgi:hypothetical protein
MMRRKPRRCRGFRRGGSTPSFLEELVYDFIFPGRSMNSVTEDTEVLMSNTSTHAVSIRSFALFGQGERKEEVYDLKGSYGRECFGGSTDGENYKGSPGRRVFSPSA